MLGPHASPCLAPYVEGGGVYFFLILTRAKSKTGGASHLNFGFFVCFTLGGAFLNHTRGLCGYTDG